VKISNEKSRRKKASVPMKKMRARSVPTDSPANRTTTEVRIVMKVRIPPTK